MVISTKDVTFYEQNRGLEFKRRTNSFENECTPNDRQITFEFEEMEHEYITNDYQAYACSGEIEIITAPQELSNNNLGDLAYYTKSAKVFTKYCRSSSKKTCF